MLERLSIRNIGGVGGAELSFSPQSAFIVITGESGAGKSSVVRAIEILAGKRNQTGAIRAGEEEGRVEALFVTELPPAEEKNLFALRLCSRSGRGGAFLQGNALPLVSYAQTMSRLLRIQSQFAQMELLDASRQLAMVDISGGSEIENLSLEMKKNFQNAVEQEKSHRTLVERRNFIDKKFSDAEKILTLARACRPEQGLENLLEAARKNLGEKIAYFSDARNALDEISGGASGQGLGEHIERTLLKLARALPEEFRDEAERSANEALLNVQKIVTVASANFGLEELRSFREEFDEAENRLGSLRKLKRMTGVDDDGAISDWCREAEEGIAWLQSSREEFLQSEARAKDARREAGRCAGELRTARKRAAQTLEGRVNACLADLAMEETKLSIRFSELPRLRRDGADEVNFVLVSPKREGSVDKIASGGELSRLLLALQLALPDEWLPETLVFDEVEAGLGGRAAVLSGEKLRELSSKCQVILVTHEASIAALGTEHFAIDKDGGEAVIKKISGEARVRELARMLAGNADLAEARAHAERLLSAQM